jgi:hypothetical protein
MFFKKDIVKFERILVCKKTLSGNYFSKINKKKFVK